MRISIYSAHNPCVRVSTPGKAACAFAKPIHWAPFMSKRTLPSNIPTHRLKPSAVPIKYRYVKTNSRTYPCCETAMRLTPTHIAPTWSNMFQTPFPPHARPFLPRRNAQTVDMANPATWTPRANSAPVLSTTVLNCRVFIWKTYLSSGVPSHLVAVARH